MNDGSAFPFVVLGLGLLGLHDIGDFGLRWFMLDVVWATLGAIAIGVVAGIALARVGGLLRGAPYRHALMDDFLGLGLIGLVYGVSVLAHTWGFLAVFFAAVALRQTELKLAREERQVASPPLESAPSPAAARLGLRGGARKLGAARRFLMGGASASQHPQSDPLQQTMVSAGSLVFKEHLERLSELLLVLLVGGSLFIDSWSWPAVALALFLFIVARPLSVLLALAGSGTPMRLRGMTAWFGVRGIGSLYYLMYAIENGLPEPLALQLVQMTLIVVALSILVHGTSVKPLMGRFWKSRQR